MAAPCGRTEMFPKEFTEKYGAPQESTPYREEERDGDHDIRDGVDKASAEVREWSERSGGLAESTQQARAGISVFRIRKKNQRIKCFFYELIL